MKSIKNIFPLVVLAASSFTACVTDEDQNLPQYNPVVYFEDFQKIPDGTFDANQWVNVAETGTKKWFTTSYQSNGYFEFSPFNSGETLNVAWLITPEIDLANANSKKLLFKIAQHHVVDQTNNHVKVYITTNYTGDVTTTTWVEKEIKLPPKGNANNYDFYSSGAVSLSEFSGKIRVGFKATGGTATANAGAYQIDDIKVF